MVLTGLSKVLPELRQTVVLLAAALCGCAAQSDGNVTRRYTGYVEITERRDANGSNHVERVRGLGLRLGSGVLIGGFDERVLSLSPACRLVVFVKTEEQLRDWERLLNEEIFQREIAPCVKVLDF